ncbi:MAG: Ig-like domain-containing protein, partial [Nitrososphaeraceae archaeon]
VGAGNLESTSITTVKVNALTTGAPETPTNTPPVAESQSVTTTEDTSVSINLDATDKDGDGLTYSLKSSPSHGSLSSFDVDTGSVVYNPDSGYTGSDGFTFTASDGTSTSNTGKVSITVNSAAPEVPTNPPPLPEHHDGSIEYSESKEEMQGEIEVQGEIKAQSEFEAQGK